MRNLWLAAFALLLFSCKGTDDGEDPDKDPVSRKSAHLESPKNDDQFTVGEMIEVSIVVDNPDNIETIDLYVADTLYKGNIEIKNQVLEISTADSKVGWVNIKLSYKQKDGLVHADNREIVFFASQEPENKVVSIVRTYPHNTDHYTQGLEFYKGKLYEGTGQWGKSGIYEKDLNTGDTLKSVQISNIYFGEGITILNETIYQLTWQNSLCFVYDMNLNKFNEFKYSGEGWGLCNDGQHLIMTNGSEEVVWRDPATFNVVKSIYVFDNQQSIGNLNECELIDGDLWINIYTENRIAVVDTARGVVKAYLDCNALALDVQMGADVLNGIARNQEDGKIYMTGKYWNKLFEVSVK